MALSFVKENGIARIGLNRPDAKNALDTGLLRDLETACMDLKSVIPVLTGARPPQTDDETWMVQDPTGMFRAMLRQREWDKPVIAAVHGLCLTGGFEMVMGTDLRVASEDALFQMREATFGIMPIGGSNVFLPRQIPLAAAKEILLLGDYIPAARLYDWGFLNRVVPKEKLLDEAMVLAERVAGNGPLAVQGCMRCMRETAEMDIDPAMAREIEIGLPIFSSADAREGVAAFKEKRRPKYRGK